MNEFICLFLPAFLTLTKKDLKDTPVNIIKKYATSVLAINFIAMLAVCILHYVTGEATIEYTYVFTIKYLVLAFVLAKILPSIHKFIKKNFKIEVRRENREKNSKRS
ncbi:hypothetical protein IKM56_03650 [Candidatus Saccharibacteria bacterium]|nr:hypothetical protein [Candidatus Saccharibacteria bacterium]